MSPSSKSENDTMILRFRTGAAMPSRLGSQQLKDDYTAIIELVKNAYDADATKVSVDLKAVDNNQRLRIQDNGSGMTLADLHEKWAWLATENKVREDRSQNFRRRRLGQKGVGRFAAEKLGSELILRTRTTADKKVHQIRFDWDGLKSEQELSDYTFPISKTSPEGEEPQTGCRLEIRRLRRIWNRKDVAKLKNQLAQLIDPESTATDFEIYLRTPWEELNGVLENPLAGAETHRIEFSCDADGNEVIRVHGPGGDENRKSRRDPPSFGPVRGRLRYFGDGLRPIDRSRGGDPEADWNMGVRIFRDGCRVRPYGEPGSDGDWLEIYRTRYLKGSRFRLRPNYLEGSIHISKDSNPDLRDTTSREGLEVNDAYEELVHFVRDKIAALSDLLREEELRDERRQQQERYSKALDPLTNGLNQLASDSYKRAVEETDRQIRKGQTLPTTNPLVRNSHWECMDCHDSWKCPKELTPKCCREHSVGRDGRPTNKRGCGSTNIRRKENVARDDKARSDSAGGAEDALPGLPAYVSGIQLRPLIDWEMGAKDDEAEVRPDRRELAINGRHRSFRVADSLDGTQTKEGTEFEELRAVAALTIHVVNAASIAWGRWHCFQSGGQMEVFLSRAAELKTAALASLPPAKEDGIA